MISTFKPISSLGPLMQQMLSDPEDIFDIAQPMYVCPCMFASRSSQSCIGGSGTCGAEG